MNNNQELIMAIEAISKEKGFGKEVLIEALEAALISAYKRNFASAQNVEVKINEITGEIKVYAKKKVVQNPEIAALEIGLDAAKQIDSSYEIDDIVNVEVTPANFGRIAAQTAKQVVMQRIREAERGVLLSEFANKENNIITGIVRRIDKGNVFLEIGNTEAILTKNDQVEGEDYKINERLKVYVTKVESGAKGVQIHVSRSHSGLVSKLFETEVPEIEKGIIEIKAVSREAGSRSKIAVYSKDPDVDAQGACIGARGNRVQLISHEIRGEKIDIIKWNSDPAEYIAASLSPAAVTKVDVDLEGKSAHVIVPAGQLSLAIGKSGQNARLAARLTGWKIDIKGEGEEEA